MHIFLSHTKWFPFYYRIIFCGYNILSPHKLNQQSFWMFLFGSQILLESCEFKFYFLFNNFNTVFITDRNQWTMFFYCWRKQHKIVTEVHACESGYGPNNVGIFWSILGGFSGVLLPARLRCDQILCHMRVATGRKSEPWSYIWFNRTSMKRSESTSLCNIWWFFKAFPVKLFLRRNFILLNLCLHVVWKLTQPWSHMASNPSTTYSLSKARNINFWA